ncbi:MAG: hypothetical protein JNL98_03100 [Bryobacterales bacterium]|nr:hypothetical protein [Bryobacterales bacterium]
MPLRRMQSPVCEASCGGRLFVFYLMVAVAAIPDVRGQDLQVSWNGRELRVAAPQLRFLTGKALDRSRNGNTVAFDLQLSVIAGQSVLQRTAERYLISYDLWEERFAVARMARDGRPQKSVSHLTPNAAEAWCLENLVLATDKLDPNRQVILQLDVRAEDGRTSSQIVGDPGISLTALIEIFSRTSNSPQAKWSLQRGPLRIADHKKGA